MLFRALTSNVEIHLDTRNVPITLLVWIFAA